MLGILSGINPKYILYTAIVTTIVTGGYFAHKWIEERTDAYESAIRELEVTKKAHEETIQTLEQLLEEEKKREKVRTVYVDRVKEIYVERKEQKKEVKELPNEELNGKFKEVMKCFAQPC